MKKLFLFLLVSVSGLLSTHALIINEIMSNPIGDDGGREWIEVYNNSSSTLDISTVTISVKGGTFVSVIPVSGGVTISPDGYAIISSIVSGVTKFSQDYPTYQGPLFRSSISLVNTGVTSLEIKVGGITQDTLASYTAAKEGLTLSKIGGSFVVGSPTPGVENQTATEDTNTSSSATTTNQATITQASLPASDIILYLPQEKVVVAGAESTFSVFGLTHLGKQIDNLTYEWAYGDGGQKVGSSTSYRYAYPGRYIVSVEASNGYVRGVASMSVRVVAPDIFIKDIHSGKYGTYIDVENPNMYDLDLSQWRLTVNGISFTFPKNTVIAKNSVTHFSGLAMGFASTTITKDTIVTILFPNQEEVTRYIPSEEGLSDFIFTKEVATSTLQRVYAVSQIKRSVALPPNSYQKNKLSGSVLGVSTSTVKSDVESKVLSLKENKKDVRLVSFFRSFFSR